MKALFDTNILIDFLKGIEQAKTELSLYDDKAISIITWMEVQVGIQPHEQAGIDNFLKQFAVLPIDSEVARQAVLQRKGRSIKLPDAVIWASAKVHNRLLVTRNTKDFPPSEPGVRMPYSLG